MLTLFTDEQIKIARNIITTEIAKYDELNFELLINIFSIVMIELMKQGIYFEFANMVRDYENSFVMDDDFIISTWIVCDNGTL